MSEFLRNHRAMEDRRARRIDQERIAARNLVIAERTVLNAKKTVEREERRQARMAATAAWDAEDDLENGDREPVTCMITVEQEEIDDDDEDIW